MSDRLRYQYAYRRKLPHIQPPGATLFITFRLAGSLPKALLQQLGDEAKTARRQIETISDATERTRRLDLEQRREFARVERTLDRAASGPKWLSDPQIAGLVADSLHFHDGRLYELDAFCLMPNHVHALLRPLEKGDGTYHALSTIMHTLKGFTARKANRLLGRTGSFWQRESFDRVVRDGAEWKRTVNYIVMNPVKAELVAQPEDWPWTYCGPEAQ